MIVILLCYVYIYIYIWYYCYLVICMICDYTYIVSSREGERRRHQPPSARSPGAQLYVYCCEY